MLRKIRYGALLPALVAMALLASCIPPDSNGAGAVQGTAQARPPVPAPGQPCRKTSLKIRFGFFIIPFFYFEYEETTESTPNGRVLAIALGECETLQSGGGSFQITNILTSGGVGSVLLCLEDPLLVGRGFKVPLLGAYVRIGPIMIVDVAGDLNVNRTPEEDCEEADVGMAALLTPTSGLVNSGFLLALLVGAIVVDASGDSADGDAGDST